MIRVDFEQTPGLLPFADALVALATAQVEFAVMGDLAVALAGDGSRPVLAAALLLRPTPTNLERAFAVLATLGYAPTDAQADDARLCLTNPALPTDDLLIDLRAGQRWSMVRPHMRGRSYAGVAVLSIARLPSDSGTLRAVTALDLAAA